MKTVLTLCIGLSLFLNANAQSPFKGFGSADVLIFEGGLVVEGLYRFINPAELSEFEKDIQKIPFFERNVIENNSFRAHRMSNVVLFSSIGIAVGNQFVYNDLSKTGYIAMETFLVTDVLTLLSKTFFRRTRPFVYNDDIDPAKEGCQTYDLEDPKIRASFFSGHTSSVTAYNFLSASFFSHYHPESNFRTPVWIAAGAISSYVGYLRVRAGKHFPTDVIAGFIAGGAAGFFIPRWHRSDAFNADDAKYWQDLGLGVGSGIVTGVLLSLLDKDPAPRQCERRLASKWEFNVLPSGFSLVYNLR